MQSSELFKGCVFYLNGSTGPKVSNLQVQHLITANGGRFMWVYLSPTTFKLFLIISGYRAMCNASCTHIVASGGLSGSKTQKWINGQAGRGASKRTKVVKIDCPFPSKIFDVWSADNVDRDNGLRREGQEAE